jgi:MarR family transcriptional regulator for hemolysin
MPLLTISRMGESVRLGVLAEAIGLEGASLTRLIEQLCASGLATRRDDPEDGRARTLHLTDEGRACAARIEGAMDEVRATLFKDVSDADLAACLRVFAQLGERLGGSMPAVIARAIDPATGSDGAT